MATLDLGLIPECRYGHGALQRIELQKINNKTRLLALATFAQTGPLLGMDGGGFTVQMFRCPQCGYLELFDWQAQNG